MPSSKSKHSLDLQNVLITDEKPEKSGKKKSKNSIYQIVRMKIFFVKNKKRNSKSKSSKSAKENGIKKTSVEFVFTVTDFDEEQIIKAKSYIKSSKYSEALSILEPISSNRAIKSDYDILFWTGHCHEYLQNYQLADKYYKLCADYLYDDGYWETTYGKFLLEKNSTLSNDDNERSERIEKGIDRLISAANKKRYVAAMYMLGKVYINGLYDVKQDLPKGELYLRRAYNGGERERSWSIYKKKAKELVENGELSKIPDEHVWAKDHKTLVV